MKQEPKYITIYNHFKMMGWKFHDSPEDGVLIIEKDGELLRISNKGVKGEKGQLGRGEIDVTAKGHSQDSSLPSSNRR